MSAYEYKTVAAPRRAGRYRGLAKGADSFARTIEETLADEAIDGWEFLRAENLPCEEKQGWLARRETVFHSILVFRRVREQVRPAAPAQAQTWTEPEIPRAHPQPSGMAEPAPAFQRRPEPEPAVQRRPEPAPAAAAPAAQADPDAALMRLEPEMREPSEDSPPRLGPADR